MTLREMQQRMGADEYQEWVRYYNVRPFGFDRTESRHADMMTSMWALQTQGRAPATHMNKQYWKFGPTKSDEDEEDESVLLAKLGG